MTNRAILIPSYNRVALCDTCIKSITKQEIGIPIYVTVERDQYKQYKKVIGRMATVIPLAKKGMGVSYSIYYGLEFLHRIGYDVILRTDDDVRLSFDIKDFFLTKNKYPKIPWMGAWFSIYDFFYKDKEIMIGENKNVLKAVSSLYSRCYIIDLDIIKDMGNWDWRYRYWDDYDMVTRLMLSGYTIAAYRKALAGSLATRMSAGGVKASIDDIDEVAKRNLELLKSKFGEKIASYRINTKGKVLMRYNWSYVKSGKCKPNKNTNKIKSLFNEELFNKLLKILKRSPR